MATIFWDTYGIIFIDYIEKGTINREHYMVLLQCLSEGIKEEHPHLVKKKVLFHRDNVSIHTSVTAMPEVHDLSCKLLPYPPYLANPPHSDTCSQSQKMALRAANFQIMTQ